MEILLAPLQSALYATLTSRIIINIRLAAQKNPSDTDSDLQHLGHNKTEMIETSSIPTFRTENFSQDSVSWSPSGSTCLEGIPSAV